MELPYEIGVALVLAVLAGFGAWYNSAVSWMERHGPIEGFRAILVMFGVTVTGIGYVLLSSIESGVLLLMCFAASGLPMLIGDMLRAIRARQRDREATQAQVREMFDDG